MPWNSHSSYTHRTTKRRVHHGLVGMQKNKPVPVEICKPVLIPLMRVSTSMMWWPEGDQNIYEKLSMQEQWACKIAFVNMLQETLMHDELSPYPPSLFDNDDTWNKSKQSHHCRIPWKDRFLQDILRFLWCSWRDVQCCLPDMRQV